MPKGGSYRIVMELDMTGRGRGCTESPVATLLRSLRELRGGDGLLIRTVENRFSPKAIEVLVKKMGYEFELKKKEGEENICVVYKPGVSEV